MKNIKKTQTILIYAALIFFVVAALIIMFPHIQRRILGLYQSAGDAIGEGELKD